MKTIFLFASIFLIAAVSNPIAAQEDAHQTKKDKHGFLYKEYHNNYKMNYPADDLTKLKVISKAGDVTILPGDNKNIVVEADVVMTSMSEKWQDRIIRKYLNLGFEQKEDVLKFRGDFNHTVKNYQLPGYLIKHLGTPGSKINFTVYVPDNLFISIHDGSGDLTVKNLSNGVYISDGSGSILVDSISGRIEVHDASGDIRIRNIMSIGELTIRDDSGDIFAENIYGNIDINDASGSIYMDEVQGLVDIRDGSGDIIAKVKDGRVNVNADGSGSKHISYYYMQH